MCEPVVAVGAAHHLRVCQRVVVDYMLWLLSDVYAAVVVLLSRSASQQSSVGLQHCVSYRHSRCTVMKGRYEIVAQLSQYLQLRSAELRWLRLRCILTLSLTAGLDSSLVSRLRLKLRLRLRLRLIDVVIVVSQVDYSMSASG